MGTYDTSSTIEKNDSDMKPYCVCTKFLSLLESLFAAAVIYEKKKARISNLQNLLLYEHF